MLSPSNFLNTYLPIYFSKVFSQTLPSPSFHNDGLSIIKFVQSCLHTSQQLYQKNKLPDTFLELLNIEFFKDEPGTTSILASQSWGIISDIKKHLHPVASTGVGLYVRCIYYNNLLEGNGMGCQGQAGESIIKQLSRICEKLRFSFQLQLIQNCGTGIGHQFDQYIQQIFSCVFDWALSSGFIKLLFQLFREDQANISQKSVQRFRKNLNKPQQMKNQTPYLVSPSMLEKKMRKNIREKKVKKEEKKRYENKKEENQEDKENSSKKRIVQFTKLRKQHKIFKPRTIYHQRKNTYLPKTSFFPEMSLKTSLSNSTFILSDRKSDIKEFSFETRCFEDCIEEQNVLVGQTPQKKQKLQLQMIAQKLSFSDF